MISRTDVKDPAEIVPFTADFTYRLAAIDAAEVITSVASIEATVTHGADATPDTIKLGAPAISSDGKKVIQNLTGGLDGVDYKMKVEVITSTGKQIVIVGVVPVRTK